MLLFMLCVVVVVGGDIGFKVPPLSGSFKISPIIGGGADAYGLEIGKLTNYAPLNQQHEMEWRGIFHIVDPLSLKYGGLKVFAHSLQSPLSILHQDGKTFMVIPHNNSCIQMEFSVEGVDLYRFVGGIQQTLTKLYNHMIVPGVKLENWKENFDLNYLSVLAGCSSSDRVFVNLLDQRYSNDALIACVNEQQIPYRIRARDVMIEIDSSVQQEDSRLFENVKTLSKTCVKHNLKKQESRGHSIRNTNRVWFVEEQEYSLLKNINKLNLKNNGTKRICVFLHGAGVRNEGVPLHEWTHYWGKVNSYTEDICSERWFIRRNTKGHGWTSEYLQTSYCELALIGNKNKTDSKVISNTIIFTHSMANLIFPAAMYKGYCQMDLTTSSWVSISAPFNGSPAAVYLNTLCYQYVHKTAPHDIQKILDFVAEVTGNCDGDKPDLADSTLLPNYCDPNTTNYHGKKPMCLGDPIFSYAEPMISARMCGSSPFGLVSYYGVALELFAQMVQYGEPNDGLVPFSSCKMTTQEPQFDSTPTSPLYLAAVNHADASCRNGDSLISEQAKMPCAFYGFNRSPVHGGK